MTKYLALIIFISLMLTSFIMKIMKQSSLTVDLIIYLIVAILITVLLFIVSSTFRKLWQP
jgi:formate hydrogenlyase subunit 4